MVYYQVAVERLSRPDATKLLRECVLKGNIIPGRRFRGELEKEGLDLQDAVRVLNTGNIFLDRSLIPRRAIGNIASRASRALKWTANGWLLSFALRPRIRLS